MGAAEILGTFAAAAAVGIGCGTCCSPFVSIFLSSYIASHSQGVKNGIKSFTSFFLGKLVSVCILCTAAALIGKQFISPEGYIGTFDLRLFSKTAMSAIGIILTVRFLAHNKTDNCSKCGCEKYSAVKGNIPLFAAGITYGITPCAPLIMMIGYSFTLPVILAGATGVVFGISSIVSPILLLTVLIGAVSKKMAEEIPHYMKYFQLISYILLIILPFAIQTRY